MKTLRLISLFLTLCMVISLLPPTALTAVAADVPEEEIVSLAEEPSFTDEEEKIDYLGDEITSEELGLKYRVKEDGKIAVSGYVGEPVNLVIPDLIDGKEVVGITYRAFRYCESLKSVQIPDTVDTIAEYAFEGCTKLETAKLPSALTEMGNSIFEECSHLTGIEIPDGVITIPHRAFYGCTQLKEIKLPAQLRNIMGEAFACSGLETVVLPDTVGAINEKAFSYCKSLKQINYPKTLQYAEQLFEGCIELKSIAVPEGVVELEPFAAGAPAVEKITLPSTLTTIPEKAFEKCVALKQIEIPQSVTVMGNGAFYGCSALEEIDLPNNMTEIPQSLFDGCTSLKGIEIPDSVTSIGRGAFSSCKSIRTIEIPDSVTEMGACLSYCDALETVILPDGLTTISDYSFTDCISLKNIDLPDGLESIGKKAFYNCASLETITLPDSVERIEEQAFTDCTALTALNYPKNLSSAGKEICTGCTSLRSAVIPEGVTNLRPLYWGASKLETIQLPSTLTAISESALQDCAALREIDLPEGLESIGRRAFHGCSSLEEIQFPDSLTSLGNHVFEDCVSLGAFNYPMNLTSVGVGIFYGCPLITSVTVPEGITELNSLLCAANHLERVSLPSTLTALGENAFNGCTALQSIQIPQSVTSIGKKAFIGCEQLTSVALPEGLTYLGTYAFTKCASLQSINIPSGLTDYGREIFTECPRLTVYCDDSCPMIMDCMDWDVAVSVSGRIVANTIIDRENSGMTVDMNGVSANGLVPMTLRYSISEEWRGRCELQELYIRLPQNSVLEESTLKLNGVLCVGNYSYGGNVLQVDTTEPQGELRFCVNAEQVTEFRGYSAVVVKYEGSTKKQQIGLYDEAVNILTLTAPDVVTDNTFTVKGKAPASAQVQVSLNGAAYTTVTASKGGSWSAEITLSAARDYSTHQITAACGSMQQTVKVVYHPGEATLTSFRIAYNPNPGESGELLTEGNVSASLVYDTYKKLYFRVAFDHPEQIEKVYVVSTRNNVKTYLETAYDAERGAFYNTEFFDYGYVPGLLHVEYVKKSDPVTVSSEMDWNQFDPFTSTVPETAVTNAQVNGEDVSATIDLGQISDALPGLMMDAAVTSFDKATDGDLEGWLGDYETLAEYLLPGKNGEKYILSADLSDPKTAIVLIKDITGSKAVKCVLDLAITDGGSAAQIADLMEISDTLSGVNTVAGEVLNQMQITEDMDALREEIIASNRAYEEVDLNGDGVADTTPMEMVDHLEDDRRLFSLMTMALPLLIVAAGPMGAPALLLSGMVGVFGMTAGLFWDQRTMQIKGESCRARIIIDPSGYVYDVDTNERIEGVKTTVYCVLSDYTAEFWENKPAENEYGTMWNAAEYDQANPLFTDAEGRYAWDVPEGWWRVKYEKDGYETVWSEWLPVPPIQTEVNIGMKNTGAGPTILRGDVDGTGVVDSNDAIYLLRHTMMPETYVLNQSGDMDGSGTVDSNDAIYLLRYTMMPDTYPIR